MRNDLAHNKPIDTIAIERLQAFEPAEGYWLAYSGGKDSTVIWDLAKRSGVKFGAHYSLTTVDPPELIHFIQAQEGIIIDRPERSLWRMIRDKGGMPTGARRWCCEVLKERGGSGTIVIEGSRWEESAARSRKPMLQTCLKDKRKQYLRPIIDWSESDVWEYIRQQELPYCTLYDEGFRRLGCVMCPKAHAQRREAARWPKIAEAWCRACFWCWHNNPKQQQRFSSPERMWEWWLDGASGPYDTSMTETETAPLFQDT